MAQQANLVKGTIVDDKGETIVGASIVQKGTTTGTMTDADGKFQLNVPGNATLVITYLGYTTKEVKVNNQQTLSIQLSEDSKMLEEVVVVGYSSQKKATLTGAVSAIKGDDIVVTKNENVQNMLTGKVPGVRVLQKSSEPGEFRNNFDIRGMGTPLIIIDGVARTMDEFQRLTPNDIDNISVLKDASAAIYGVRSANGVVLITTKGGTKGAKPQITYDGSYSLQFPSGLPGILGAVDYINVVNENSMRSLTDPKWAISEATLNDYVSGKKQGYDWYDYEFKEYAPQTQHSLSVDGGNDRTTYYVGLGYLYQNSFFNTDDRKYSKWNVNSKLSTKLTDDLTFDIHLSSIMDQRDSPNQSAVWTIRDFWRMNPLVGPYADPAETMYNHDVVEGENPFSFIHSDLIGWQQNQKRWFEGQGNLKYDVPGVKGLSVKATFSYNYYVGNNTTFKKEYKQYIHEPTSDTYKTYTVSSPSQLSRSNYIRTHMMSNFMANYERTFNNVHRVNGLLVWESQWRKGDNFNARRDLVIPLPYIFAGKTSGQIGDMLTGQSDFYETTNNALAGQFNYSFADKYLLEFLFRYDGSSMWAPGHQWGFFPGGSVGWRVSEENFFKESSLSFIDQLKLRASYGSTGDEGGSAYQFMTGYNYPTSGRDWNNTDRNASVSTNGREFSGGYVFDGSYVNSVDNKGIPNPNITWYKSNIFNVGVDFEAWDGLFGFTFEYFNRVRTGLLAKRLGGIPTVVGAMLPDENLNSDRHFGLELLLTHRNKVNDNFNYRASLMGSITRQERLDVESPARGSSWNYWKDNQANRLQGMYNGFGYLGQYQGWEDVWNSPVYIGRGTLPGDYIYEDWNGDGEINDNDKYAIRFNQDPWTQFSASFGASYKRFDLDVLFQGAAMSSQEYGEQMRGDSKTLEVFSDRWHPVDSKADPFDPATQWIKGYYSYANGGRRDNSAFNVESTAYLRLKNIELGYNVPKFKGIDLRFYVSGYNVFTLTKIRNTDPEHPGNGDSWGFIYPLDKKLTFGLTLKF